MEEVVKVRRFAAPILCAAFFASVVFAWPMPAIVETPAQADNGSPAVVESHRPSPRPTTGVAAPDRPASDQKQDSKKPTALPAPTATQMPVASKPQPGVQAGDAASRRVLHRTPDQARVEASAAQGNLVYHDGPVQRATSRNHVIFWKPPTAFMSPNYQSLITRYFNDIGGSSLYGLLTQYSDATGNIVNSSSLGGVHVDTTEYPSTTLNDVDIQNAVKRAIIANGWTPDVTSSFFVFTAYGVTSCDGPSSCAYAQFCGYHGVFQMGSQRVLYANMPYPSQSSGPQCSNGLPNGSPNNDRDADSAISVASHEHFEIVTDPVPGTGWFDDQGKEIGDKCAWRFGSNVDPISGANVTLNGHPYIVQTEWSNADGACVLAPGPTSAGNDAFANAVPLSVPSSITGTNLGATLQSGEPTPCGSMASTVWYRLVPPASGALSIDTVGSQLDTVVSLYSGSSPLSSLALLGCNDDDLRTSGVRTSFLSTPLNGGLTYFVQVGGAQGAQGSFQLNVTFTVQGGGPANNTMANAVSLSVPGSVIGSNQGAGLEAGEPTPCGNIASTVWYRFTPQSTGVVSVDTTGSSFDTVLALYLGTSVSGLSQLVCNDDDPRANGGQTSFLSAAVAAGQTYYVQVGGYSGLQGSFKVNLNATAAGLTLDAVWPNDSGTDFSTIKTVFARGDQVRYVALVSNHTGATATFIATWTVNGPGGPIASYSQELTTEPGSTLWGLRSTIPQNAALGSYAYMFTLTHNGQPATRQATFSVVGSGTTTPTRTATPTGPGGPSVGGRGLTISTAGAGVQLGWQSGIGQTGYQVLRLADGTLSTIATLALTATGFSDTSVPSGLNCYVVMPLGTSPQSYSDLLCADVGSRSPTSSPQNFSLQLNQSTTASLRWSAPGAGGQDSYLVVAFGVSSQNVDANTTSATMQANGLTCYAIGTMRDGALIGYSDRLCALPGFTTFGALAVPPTRGVISSN